ncbi:Essential protein Yae1, N-terminal [Trifolium repens]|nr:Essential protein Yae1, N-terminal [Trifolium repens]
MEGKLAEELYAESLQLSNLELSSNHANNQGDDLTDCDDGDNLNLDDSEWYISDDEKDRELQRSRDEFHTTGYREGLIAAKEASAQEGFNIGFKQSVHAGYRWGVVRGVASAFAHLPDQLKEKLVEKLEKRSEFQGLYQSVQSLSTTDALRLFHEDITAQEASEQSEHVDVSCSKIGFQEKTSHNSPLVKYRGQLESLICDSPAIDSHLPEPK